MLKVFIIGGSGKGGVEIEHPAVSHIIIELPEGEAPVAESVARLVRT
ncbi:hypothetical protein [Luteimonas sp. A649]